MPNDPASIMYEQWGHDASALYEIGKYWFREKHPIQVRLSRELADRALDAWRRDDDGALPVGETPEQKNVRSVAGTLALIGSTLEDGFITEGQEVIFELDAWIIGLALEATDEAGFF